MLSPANKRTKYKLIMKQTPLLLLVFLALFFLPQLGSAQSSGHKVIVPAYFFPYDNADPGQHNVGPYWSTLIEAAGQYGDRLVVIANVNSGPGDGSNAWAVQKYQEAITKVRNAGGVVLGYVHLCYGLDHSSAACSGRNLQQVQGEISRWHNTYSVDGYFFDEAPTDAGKLQWLKDLDNYAKNYVALNFDAGRKLYRVMHYGTTPGSGYLSTPDWIHSVCERPINLYPSGPGAKPDVNAALQQVGYNAQLMQGKPAAAMLYQQGGLTANQQDAHILSQLQQQLRSGAAYSALDFTWDDAKARLAQKGFTYLYVTDDGADGNPWDKLPDFFWRLF